MWRRRQQANLAKIISFSGSRNDSLAGVDELIEGALQARRGRAGATVPAWKIWKIPAIAKVVSSVPLTL